MPRPMKMEKSKDFKGSLIRLIKDLKPWRTTMIMALMLALTSAIIALVTPNKLSELTDLITGGIKPNTEVVSTISKNIISSFGNKDVYFEILNDENVSDEDKTLLSEAFIDLQNKKTDKFYSLPEEIITRFLSDMKIDGVIVSKSDQYQLLLLMPKMSSDAEENVKLLNDLPESISSLLNPSIDMDSVKKISLFIAILYLISAIFNYIEDFSLTTVSNNFAKHLRTSISNKINKIPLKYFDSHETGDILSRTTNDVDTISRNLNDSISTIVSSIALLIGSTIMMFSTNWIMALTAIFSSLIGFAFLAKILGKSQKYFVQRQVEIGNINGYIEEIYSAHNVVKAYNGEKDSIEHFDEINDRLYVCNKKGAFFGSLMPSIMNFIGNFGYVCVCVVGSMLAIKGVISFGTIIAFMIYVRLFTNPLSQIAQCMTTLQSTVAASERVHEFLDEKEMSDESNCTAHLDKSKVKGNIEFKNVKFGYDKDRIIIKKFNANAKSGQKIAIVGPTGAGKTTMVNLLMKFYEINSGDILIDDVSINNLTRENVHDLFIMVLQDTWLFEGSVRDNITFNKKDVSDEQIWDALKVVGVDHFVKTLPGGLNATLNDSDAISQGQKQLLTIARGMIEDAPFLILDEATSNVDTRTEELVQKAMDKLTEGRTSFIIAHRLSTIKNADLILVMKDGNIIEQGNHEELMKEKGFYSELYNSQFEKVS